MMKVSFDSITTGLSTVSVLFSKYTFTTQVDKKGESFLKLTKENLQKLKEILEKDQIQENKELLEKLSIDCSTPGEIRFYTKKEKLVRVNRSVFLEVLKQLR